MWPIVLLLVLTLAVFAYRAIHQIVIAIAFPYHILYEYHKFGIGEGRPKEHNKVYIGHDELEWMFIEPQHPIRDPRDLIVFCHGNMCTIKTIYDAWQPLCDLLDSDVLLIEYPGYLSDPTQSWLSESYIKEHCKYTLMIAVDRHKLHKRDIYFAGQSVGTGVAAYLATCGKWNTKGLLLHSPYKSLVKIMIDVSVPAQFDLLRLVDAFNTVDALCGYKKIDSVVLLAAQDDEVIPFSHANDLNQLVPGSTLFMGSGGHNGISGKLVLRAYRRLLGYRDEVDEKDPPVRFVK
jgi:hypothetical protein